MKDIFANSQRRDLLLEPVATVPDGSSWRQAAEDRETANLRDYWLVIRKHKAVIAACFFGAVIVAAVVVFMMTPIYTARTTLLIERKEPQVVDVKNVLSESLVSGSDDSLLQDAVRTAEKPQPSGADHSRTGPGKKRGSHRERQ